MADVRQKFFKVASAEVLAEGVRVMLDGRPMRTPKGASFCVPTRTLGDAIAAEWNALGETIDPRALPLTRLANTAIDGVAQARDAVLGDLRRWAGADLVCYRADAPEGLAVRQSEAWDPWLAWAERTLGASLRLTQGILPVPQTDEALDALAAAAGRFGSFELTALHTAVGLLGSVVLGLALADGGLGAREAWALAQVDETWQEERWGVDPEAALRARALEAELGHCERFLRLLRVETGRAAP